MNPVAATTEHTFSPCSVGNICSMMSRASGGRTNTSCLINANDVASSGRTIISLQQCGNGIVEGDEQCDPGTRGNGTANACCDPATCRLRAGAQCDPASSTCCAPTCAFAPQGQVCRPALAGGCDVEETCTGASGACPADVTHPNGQSCGAGSLACAAGVCTSPDSQYLIAGLA